jgi:hypothetical protein
LGSITDRTIESLVSPVIRKHGIPDWAKTYIVQYIKSNVKKDPVGTIRHGISFVDIGRKKGVVTKSKVRLPNGTEFGVDSVARILSLFLYGEERLAEIERSWSMQKGPGQEYVAHFDGAFNLNLTHARAVRNLLEGLGKKQVTPTAEIVEVFDYISSIREWEARLVATEIMLRYSYSIFGIIFYKSFYASSAEFMRSFGKAFRSKKEMEWGQRRAREILSSGTIGGPELSFLSDELLTRIWDSVNSEMSIAEDCGIGTEAKLLRDIAIAYPIHIINECRPDFDVEEALKRIRAGRTKSKKRS